MAAAAQTRGNDEYSEVMGRFKERFGTFNGDVVDLTTGQVLHLSRALKEWGAEEQFEFNDRTVNPINELFSHADSIKITSFYMDPSSPIFGHTGYGKFNTFTGWWRTPSAEVCDEDVAPWLTFIDEVLRDIPGGKTEGTGKSLLAKSVAEMLGTSLTNQGLLKPAPALTTSGDRIFSNFNKLLEGKVLIVADELGSNKAHHSAIMKDLVTSNSLTVEAKFRDSYTQRNYLNFILTTNNTTATLIDEHSRRDVIFTVQQQNVILMRQLGGELVRWCEDGGYEKMLAWYFARDINKFEPMAKAPRFVGWEDSVMASKSNSMQVQDALVMALLDYGKPVALSKRNVKFALTGLGYEDGDDYGVLRRIAERREVFVGKRTIRFEKGKAGEQCCLFNSDAEPDVLRTSTQAFMKFVGAIG
jgi:hypothetical protein